MRGATTLRPGYQAMLEGAREAEFQVVVAESLDRSRDQEDIAALFKRLQFAGIRLVTVREGDIGVLHIGLKGTMNALFLKDLADKTRRGLRGRVEAGKSGGGNAHGYDFVRSYDADCEPVRGRRTINPARAAIVREIFTRYAAGEAPREIAFDLSARRIAAPRGRRLEREHAQRQSQPRHWRLEQRDVCRSSRLEPAELRQGSGDG
jgi:DNA invertase Pin-like site-specific DNA recombinase